MASRRHVLKATEMAVKAFFESEDIEYLPDTSILRLKEYVDRNPPLLGISADSAQRGRAKNWLVTIGLVLKTTVRGEPSRDQNHLDFSDDMELAVIDALEQYVPATDQPQPLAQAIMAAAVAAGVVDPDKYMMNDCKITDIEQSNDADGHYVLGIGLSATVISTA